jgi:hypothetical protein
MRRKRATEPQTTVGALPRAQSQIGSVIHDYQDTCEERGELAGRGRRGLRVPDGMLCASGGSADGAPIRPGRRAGPQTTAAATRPEVHAADGDGSRMYQAAEKSL